MSSSGPPIASDSSSGFLVFDSLAAGAGLVTGAGFSTLVTFGAGPPPPPPPSANADVDSANV
ncbi:MAG: hypothetical protein OXF19_00390, partial [Hyphomicrobiales bacterium]|nr:hypothetical protein [Hyphomicrobiales bacterium]